MNNRLKILKVEDVCAMILKRELAVGDRLRVCGSQNKTGLTTEVVFNLESSIADTMMVTLTEDGIVAEMRYQAEGTYCIQLDGNIRGTKEHHRLLDEHVRDINYEVKA